MPDSETKNPEQQETKTPAVSVEMVRHQGNPDKITKRVRGEGGKFVKQPKTMPKSADMRRLLRNYFAQAEAGPDGKMRKGDITRTRKVIDNIYKIASTDPHRPLLNPLGHPYLDAEGNFLTFFDAKAAMAATQAFKELWLNTWGQYPKSDEELESMKTQSVKVVLLQYPEMMDKTVIEDKPREALKPAFIEAEIIENK
jgi:hypothetical protein